MTLNDLTHNIIGLCIDIHKAQNLTYLKMSNLELAFLINFREPLLKNGIHRFINSATSAETPRSLREVKQNV